MRSISAVLVHLELGSPASTFWHRCPASECDPALSAWGTWVRGKPSKMNPLAAFGFRSMLFLDQGDDDQGVRRQVRSRIHDALGHALAQVAEPRRACCAQHVAGRKLDEAALLPRASWPGCPLPARGWAETGSGSSSSCPRNRAFLIMTFVLVTDQVRLDLRDTVSMRNRHDNQQ